MEPLLAFLAGVIAAGAAGVVICKRLGGRRRSAEERARRAEELLRQVENRADAAELAGGLIHEIKNPLNSLSMNLQLLAEDWATAATQEERRALKRIERLQTETSRLAAILDEFTDFVRKRKLAMTPCYVNSILEGY